MPVSHSEANLALADVARTRRRASRFLGYRRAGPHLQVWGLVWLLGYGLPAVLPGLSEGWTWTLLDIVGVTASIRLSLKTAGEEELPGLSRLASLRMMATFAVIFLFVGATLAVMHPANPAAWRVYPALVLGAIYAAVGIYALPRFLVIAAVLAGASLLAFFLAPQVLSLVISLVGGGGLVLGGFWMRRI
jgi:hypothetical protein